MAGTIVVDRIESDASYTSTINVANKITFSNTVNFGVFAGTVPVAGFYLPTTNNLAFTTTSTERMRIDSSGIVGIGVTPSAWGSGAGAIQTVNNAFFTGYGNSGYIGQNAYRDGSGIWRYQATNPAARYGVGQGDGSFEWSRAASGTAGDAITFTQSMTLSATGLLTLASGQIKFPATQNASSDANTLDDYEEGTWTPLAFHVSSNNPTFGSRSGFYVKIGGIVHCWFLCDSGNSGTAGSVLKISGLPFTAASTNLAYGTGGIWSTNGTIRTGNIFINASSALVQLYNGGGELTEQQQFISGYFTFRVT
jgi:hypothetical protein